MKTRLRLNRIWLPLLLVFSQYGLLRKPSRVKKNKRKNTNENISRRNEKNSRSNEENSRRNEENSRRNEKLSRTNENISCRN